MAIKHGYAAKGYINDSTLGRGMTTLKKRSELHLSRKIFHVFGVSVVIFLYLVLDRKVSLSLLAGAMAFFIPVDFFRRRIPALQKIALNSFGFIMREDERSHLSGVAYMMVGVFIVAYIFPPSVVVLSLLLLGLGDPISSIVGTLYGKDKLIGRKSLQGTFAGFVVCTIAGFFYFSIQELMVERIVLVSILTGLVGAVSEVFPVGKLDDNLTFPVLSSVLLFGLFYLFGGF
ncbi:MAG: hypothetical protein KDD25_02205 [Bdellovibrionales bacterium]|nr:hypothetical protein [Bdellovibrionales bacterium]